MRRSKFSGGHSSLEWSRLKREQPQCFKRGPGKASESRSKWRVLVQREVDRLYRQMLEMEASGLVVTVGIGSGLLRGWIGALG